MKLARLLPFAFLALATSQLCGQGTAFVFKGGLTLGVQKWNGFDQDPLFKYHGALAIESLSEDDMFSVYVQGGYHLKGSALRNQNFVDINGNPFRLPAQEFIFRNVSLVLGGKGKKPFGENSRVYYLLGLRGDYTLSTNLDKYKDLNTQNGGLFYPDNNFVRKWNYGVTAGGGIEFDFGDLVGGVLEVTVNPDFSQQYRQPDIPNVYNPFTMQNQTIPERTVRNITFEITAGFRLLRRVEYID